MVIVLCVKFMLMKRALLRFKIMVVVFLSVKAEDGSETLVNVYTNSILAGFDSDGRQVIPLVV